MKKIPVSTNLLNSTLGIREPIVAVSFDKQNSIVFFHTEANELIRYNINDITPEKLELNYTSV